MACLVLATQPSAASPVPAPIRELPWAQLNFLHTTDTHGWHAGHLLEPSYSADWGDYISFSEHLRQKADDEGRDLLLIDTGDRIEGNGLYDASRPKGKYDLNIFSEQEIDAICSGNHELYKRASVEYEYNTTVPHFHDQYIASNLDVLHGDEKQPLAQRFKKFTTKNQGIRILTFGFLFNFVNGADNIIVQEVEDTIKEKWFQEAIRDRKVDLFLVIGHVPVNSPEFEAIFKAIRGQQWDVPIQFFGGHTHIRDYYKFDKKAYALESGRYLETIGFQSIDGLNAGEKKHYSLWSTLLPSSKRPSMAAAAASPTYKRRYIDNNLYSFHHHTSLNSTTFPTSHGLNVSAAIKSARKSLHLDKRFGCAPRDYWMTRSPFPSEDSIFSLLQDHVFPNKVRSEERQDIPTIALTNTGAMRFDIFKGPFTIDSMFSVSPFTSGFRAIEDVPFDIAEKLLRILNQEVPQLWPIELATELRARAPVTQRVLLASDVSDVDSPSKPPTLFRPDQQQQQMPMQANAKSSEEKNNEKEDDDNDLTPGYKTTDDAGTDGDDTKHSKIKFYKVPNVISSRISFPPKEASSSPATKEDSTSPQKHSSLPSSTTTITSNEPEKVDLVYNAFLEKYVLLALRFLGTGFDEGSTKEYLGGKTMTEVLGEWVGENWPCDDGGEDSADEL